MSPPLVSFWKQCDCAMDGNIFAGFSEVSFPSEAPFYVGGDPVTHGPAEFLD